MAKKFGKFVLFSALAGAAAAGTYYYLQKKQNDPLKDMDMADDFEDFDDEFDDETFDAEDPSKNRSYVSLDLENAKEKLGEKVIETIDKAKVKVENFNVSEKLDRAKEIIGEMTSSEPSYTKVNYTDVSSYGQENTETETAASDVEAPQPEEVQAPSPCVSQTYSSTTESADAVQPEADDSTVEEFFDDTEAEK